MYSSMNDELAVSTSIGIETVELKSTVTKPSWLISLIEAVKFLFLLLDYSSSYSRSNSAISSLFVNSPCLPSEFSSE